VRNAGDPLDVGQEAVCSASKDFLLNNDWCIDAAGKSHAAWILGCVSFARARFFLSQTVDWCFANADSTSQRIEI
jgi:hypothetical protein